MNRWQTKILKTQSEDQFEKAVQMAIAFLHQDEIIGVPTETVYGLAGNAFSSIAIRRIFNVKGRPITNPLIVHIADWEMLHRCVVGWNDQTQKLANAFWPGPLTMVLEKAKTIPQEVVAGGDTVAIRWPQHPVMLAMIKAFGNPLAAPSANRSNALSPTQAIHVKAQLDGSIPLIIDGGSSSIGIESNVVDMTCRPARLLRPGMISPTTLQSVCQDLKWDFSKKISKSEIMKSPGMSPKHYAPRAKLFVTKWIDEASFHKMLSREGIALSEASVMAYENIPKTKGLAHVSTIPNHPEAYARAFFAELFLCDASGSEVIFVEAIPNKPEWMGIADRLFRASSRFENSQKAF